MVYFWRTDVKGILYPTNTVIILQTSRFFSLQHLFHEETF